MPWLCLKTKRDRAVALTSKANLAARAVLKKPNAILRCRTHICVLPRTDASGDEIFHRIAAFSQTDADVLLVDGVRSIDSLREARKITNKPILFNQIAGGRSPRIGLSELREAGATLALYSTPCLFAAQTAINRALTDIFANDGMSLWIGCAHSRIQVIAANGVSIKALIAANSSAPTAPSTIR